MSRANKSAERIREDVSIAKVLADYGYDVDPRGEDREQQFSCDLHGDGYDQMPSARLYPDTSQFFCFACGRSRDAIALVREKENLTFWDAVKALEKRHGLDPLPWEPGDDERAPTTSEVLEEALDRSETPDQALHRLETFLYGIVRERSLDPLKCAGLWEAFDRIRIYRDEEGDPKRVSSMSHKVLGKAKTALKAKVEA